MPRPCPHNVLRFYQKNVYYCQKCYMPFVISMTDHPNHEEMRKLKGVETEKEWSEMKTQVADNLNTGVKLWSEPLTDQLPSVGFIEAPIEQVKTDLERIMEECHDMRHIPDGSIYPFCNECELRHTENCPICLEAAFQSNSSEQE